MFRRWTTLLLYLVSAFEAVSSSGYKWPDPSYEALENLLITDRLSTFADKCRLRGQNGSSPVAASWVRFAYHDMATHNVEDGTGGMDASLHFEIPLNRAENIGNMRRTQADFEGVSDGVVSKADVIALGVVLGVASCGGPILDFRGGRIDATGPGPEGVPKPDQTIEQHVEKFRLQGFNETDMIALVACGHTLGGVNSDDFPQIVPPYTIVPPDDPSSYLNTATALFDSPNGAFDNHVVTEYLDGTTKNPLVFGAATTNLSDSRIFLRDGNATMKSLRSPSVFNQRCKSLLERMIDTVPKTVQLMKEPITFIKHKVSATRFAVYNDTAIAFEATYRQSPEPAPSQNRTVRFCWCDRLGPERDCSSGLGHCTVPVKPRLLDEERSDLSARMGVNFNHTEFRILVDPARSVSSFWFEVTEGGPKAMKVINTDGRNFEIMHDEVSLWIPRFGGVKAVGVHESVQPKRVVVRAIVNSPFATRNETFELQLNNTLTPIGGYHFYTTRTLFNPGEDSFTQDAVVELQDGRSIELRNESPFASGAELTPISDNVHIL